MDPHNSQTKTFQGKKLTFTPPNYNSWRPNMMSQLEANFQQLGNAIPTGDWPDYIGQFRQAKLIGRNSYAPYRQPVSLGMSQMIAASETKEPEQTGAPKSSDDDTLPRSQELLQLKPQTTPNSDRPTEAELKYKEERFTADLGKLHSVWQFILSGISLQSDRENIGELAKERIIPVCPFEWMPWLASTDACRTISSTSMWSP